MVRTILLSWITPALLVGLVGLGLYAPTERDVIKKEYEVEPGGVLSVDLDRGEVTIETTSEDKVMIELERTVRAETKEEIDRILTNRHRYSFEKTDHSNVHVSSRIVEESRRFRIGRGPKIRIRLSVRVPERYGVSFTNGFGDVTILDVSGKITGHTGAGNIVLDDVHGPVDIRTGAGNADVTGDLTSAQITTGAGNVSLLAYVESVSATTAAGNVDVELLDNPTADSRLRTAAGNITLAIPEEARVNIDGTTSLGTVSCEFPLEVEKRMLKSSVTGKLNGGGATIALSTAVGNVSLIRN